MIIEIGRGDGSEKGTTKILSLVRNGRDPYATRILEFVDTPEWLEKGSRAFRDIEKDKPKCKDVKYGREHIRHLVLNVENPWQWNCELDWSWPLKVR